MMAIRRCKYVSVFACLGFALAGCSTLSPEQQQINRAMALQMLMNMPPPPKAQFTPMQIPQSQYAPIANRPGFDADPVATRTNSVTAMWTGNQRQVQTVTYQNGWSCEYRYLSQTFWRTFIGTCPATIQVQ